MLAYTLLAAILTTPSPTDASTLYSRVCQVVTLGKGHIDLVDEPSLAGRIQLSPSLCYEVGFVPPETRYGVIMGETYHLRGKPRLYGTFKDYRRRGLTIGELHSLVGKQQFKARGSDFEEHYEEVRLNTYYQFDSKR